MSAEKKHILCVDDEPNILRALGWVLKKEYLVTTAESGAAALALMERQSFDVIISDQRMPKMMGAELLAKARSIQPRAMRILLTGYSDMEAIVDSVNEGEIFRYLKKPWQIPDLKRAVAEAVNISQQSNPTEQVTNRSVDGSDCRVLVIDDNEEITTMVGEVVGELVGDSEKTIIANDISGAIAALERKDIGVVVSDINIGGIDVTRLIKILKAKAPEIATVVLSSRADSHDVIKLINQGQVYRFIFKPIKKGGLKLLIKSAIEHHHQLKADPSRTKRYQVESLSEEELQSFLDEASSQVSKEALSVEAAPKEGLVKQITSGLSRLFRK